LKSREDGTLERFRTFSTMTANLLALSDWLTSLDIKDIALESTGVYWRPVVRHEALSDREGMRGPLQ